MFGRQKLAMIVAEFLGTGILTMAVYTIIARTSFPLFSGMAAGLTIAVLTMAVGAASGAHFNPAITFGLWTIRKVPTVKAIVYIAAQMLGAVAAWTLLKYFLGHSLTSIAGEFQWKIFVAEALGTAVFAFGFASAVLQKFENSKTAAVVGISLTVGILVASLASNAILNPAVALGMQSWSWTYAAAPLVGALVGMGIYNLLFVPDGLLQLAQLAPASASTSTRSRSSSAAAKPKKSTAKRKSTARRK